MIKNSIVFCLLLIAVNNSAQISKSIMPDAFYNCWLASYEEDEPNTNIKIYRPCDYKEFKPSMFRQSITYEKNGVCKYLQLSPNDAHYFVEGKWIYNKKKKVVTIKDDKNKDVFKFKIKKLEKTLMKAEFIEPR